MSLFQNHYALIDEVWNQPVFSPSIVNRFKEQGNAAPDLAMTVEPSDQMVKRALNQKYKVDGIVGVKPLLDDAIIRDIQSEALARHLTRSQNGLLGYTLDLSKEDYMYILLGLFAILFALDSTSS